MRNVRVHDGKLTFREALWGLGDPPDAQSALTAPAQSAENPWRQQIPRLIVDFQDAIYPSRLVVTSREILYFRDVSGTGVWRNLTPIYTTGTVSINNGATALAGSGTLWVTRKIDVGNWVELPQGSGSWYQIDSVAGETSLSLRTAYGGSNLSGAAYTIRRSFNENQDASTIDQDRNFFAQIFDGDLYIGGAMGYRGDGVVLKVPDIFGTTAPAASDVVYVFGGAYVYTSGLDYVNETFIIRGMQIIEDGRIVLAGVVPGVNSARIRYSSHTDNTVWTSGAAGARDAVSRGSAITGLGRLGFDLTLHYPDGIVLAALTGFDDPPLSYRPSEAEFGTVSPMALMTIGGAEVFPSLDMNIRFFNRNDSPILSPDARKVFEENALTVDHLAASHAQHYQAREEYRLYIIKGNETIGLTVNIATGDVQEYQWGTKIGAAIQKTPLVRTDAAKSFTRDGLVLTVGINPWDGSALGPLLPQLAEDAAYDDSTNITVDDVTANNGIYLISDSLDFGLPGILKLLSRIVLIYKTHATRTTGNEALEISISRDNGINWETVTATLTYQASDEKDELHVVAHFTNQESEKFLIRLQGENDGTVGRRLGFSLGPMVAYVTPKGPVEVSS